MKLTKKTLSLVLALVMVASMFAGCGKKEEAPAPEAGGEAVKPIELSLAHHHTVGSISDLQCTEFARLVDEKTNGAIKVTVYPGAQLGTENEVADGLMNGSQQLGAITAAGTYVDSVPGFGVDNLPFVFTSFEELSYVFNESELGDFLNEKLIANGARVLGWAPLGARHMIFTDERVTSFKDMKGMTMRSPEASLYTSMFQAMGCSPTPITWSECYTAMQTKVASGMETPISPIIDMKFCEVTDYCLLTNHMWSTFTITVNEELFQSLSPEHQTALLEAGVESAKIASDASAAAEDGCIEKAINEYGMEFIELPEGEAEELAALMEPMKAEWCASHPDRQEAYDICMAAIAEFRAK